MISCGVRLKSIPLCQLPLLLRSPHFVQSRRGQSWRCLSDSSAMMKAISVIIVASQAGPGTGVVRVAGIGIPSTIAAELWSDSMPDHGSKLIVALDFFFGEALSLASRLDPSTARLKVGKQLFTVAGPDVVRDLQERGFDVFLDLKFHDIPNTVAMRCVRQRIWVSG